MAERAMSPDACGHGAPALSVDEARQRINAEIQPIGGCERVLLIQALGRVLAEDVVSPIDVPAHTNSAMDGYALASRDLPASGMTELAVVGTAWAGRPFTAVVQPGQCVRIMTGAPLPAGADTVVLQEQTRRRGNRIAISAGHQAGQNVRAAGEDLSKGKVVLPSGTQVQPAELGMLASLGLAEVSVKRQLRVAFFSTGDELRAVGEPLAVGQIYDSNRYTLFGMLSRLGADVIDMGIVPDDRDATRAALLQAADAADAIITSGGVSVGEADHVKEALDALGRISFWQIAIKPGRPLAFGRVRDAAFFGLPGNPVSVMVTFYQFVEPALRRMMGHNRFRPTPTFKVPCASAFKKGRGRTEVQRAILERDASGELVVRSVGPQGSGILHSMSAANCFVILAAESDKVEPGMLVEVQPFYGVI